MIGLSEDGVFWTIQGEGVLSGVPMAFVRLAGCSVGGPSCDTNYQLAERVQVDEIVDRVLGVTPAVMLPMRPWVWLTGGEPTDQHLDPLITALSETHNVALCTAAPHNSPFHNLLRWVSVSPHAVAEGLHGHEVKIVPGLGRLTLEDVGWLGSFGWRFIQPLAGDDDELTRTIDFVKTHPGWILSTQRHKAWDIR